MLNNTGITENALLRDYGCIPEIAGKGLNQRQGIVSRRNRRSAAVRLSFYCSARYDRSLSASRGGGGGGGGGMGGGDRSPDFILPNHRKAGGAGRPAGGGGGGGSIGVAVTCHSLSRHISGHRGTWRRGTIHEQHGSGLRCCSLHRRTVSGGKTQPRAYNCYSRWLSKVGAKRESVHFMWIRAG